MEVSFSNCFKKVLKKRIEGTASEDIFWEKLEVFISPPFDPKLKTHKLSGRLKGSWSFSIDYDMRVVFYFTKDKPQKAVFVDIGNHNEVY